MEPKNKIWLVYLLNITFVAFFLADITNLILGDRLEASASLLSKDKEPFTPVISFPVDSRQASLIIEGNLFNSKLRGKKEEPFAALPPEPVPDLQARFRLIGTVDGSPDSTFAIIEDLVSKEQSLYHLNERIMKNVRITEIRRNRVRLAYNGGSELLQIQLDEERSATPPPAALPSPLTNSQNTGNVPQGIRQLASNQWVLDRQEVSHNLDNLNQLLTQARVIPNFTDGKPDGFRLFAIIPESFYEKIGLKNGDVLQRVNGVEIKDPESFLKVFQHLKDEDQIHIDLMRNSQKETMNYEIR